MLQSVWSVRLQKAFHEPSQSTRVRLWCDCLRHKLSKPLNSPASVMQHRCPTVLFLDDIQHPVGRQNIQQPEHISHLKHVMWATEQHVLKPAFALVASFLICLTQLDIVRLTGLYRRTSAKGSRPLYVHTLCSWLGRSCTRESHNKLKKNSTEKENQKNLRRGNLKVSGRKEKTPSVLSDHKSIWHKLHPRPAFGSITDG